MNTFGKIVVIDSIRVKNKVKCLCECGTEKWINIFNLRKGDVKSCGCLKREKMKKEAYIRFFGKLPANFSDYVGRKIGLITVIKRTRLEEKETFYLVKCECGTEFETSNFRRAKFSKCRCGFQKHPLKETLQRMIQRCENPKDKSFKWYGKKGISVCDEWRRFPTKFIQWSLNNGWQKGLSIDRVDSSGNYQPDNCKWITRSCNCKKAIEERWARKNSG